MATPFYALLYALGWARVTAALAEISMYKLPEKFTGLNADLIGADEFKSLCYSLQGLSLLSVHSIEVYEYPRNYYVAKVSDKAGKFEIYLNCFVGAVGIGNVGMEAIDFISKPGIEAAVPAINSKYVVVPAEILNSEASKESVSDLRPIEAKEVYRWLPSTIGKLLFSWYFD